jgi:hypothetical protein
MGAIQSQWRRGRYYRQNDAIFQSAEIDLSTVSGRVTPEPNWLKDPYGHDRWDEQAKRLWPYSPEIKLLGLSWTGYTQEVKDYKQIDKPLLRAQLEICIEVPRGGKWVQVAGPFLNIDSGWAPLLMKPGTSKLRYSVRFNTRCDPDNAILLETPILDDLTIYYTTGPQFTSWVESY